MAKNTTIPLAIGLSDGAREDGAPGSMAEFLTLATLKEPAGELLQKHEMTAWMLRSYLDTTSHS